MRLVDVGQLPHILPNYLQWVVWAQYNYVVYVSILYTICKGPKLDA